MTNDNDDTFQELAGAVQEIDRLKAELFIQLDEVIELKVRLMENNTALRQLLAPTIELLDRLSHSETLSCTQWAKTCRAELARLTAAMEGKV